MADMGRVSNQITEDEQRRARTEDPNVRVCLSCGERYSRRVGQEGSVSFQTRKYCSGTCTAAGKREEAMSRPCPKGHARTPENVYDDRGRLGCRKCRAERESRRRKNKVGSRTSQEVKVPRLKPQKAPRQEPAPLPVFPPGPKPAKPWRPPGWSEEPNVRGGAA